jgi:4'-phosphopantetheinyl transferase
MRSRDAPATVLDPEVNRGDWISRSALQSGELHIRDQDVHVWTVRLVGSAEQEDYLCKLLSLDEKRRACRLRHPPLRRNFTLSHGLLRVLLSRYLQLSPSDIEFRYGSTGKPRLSAEGSRLQFSMAHSDRMVVYAFANDCELGVDIERASPFSDLESVAAEFFCPEEYAEFISIHPAQRCDAFFTGWTRKEALVKAVGGGLSMPLDSFRVGLRSGQGAVVARPFSESCGQSWHVHHLTPAPGYVGALVFSGGDRAIQTWCFASADELCCELSSGFGSGCTKS